MRNFRSVDSVRAALAAALGFTALSCGGRNAAGFDDIGPTADTGVPHSPDATSSPDGVSPSDVATIDTGGPGDAAGGQGPDVLAADCTPLLIGGKVTGYVTCNGQLQRRAVADCPNRIAQIPPLCNQDAGRCSTDKDCSAMQYGTCRSTALNGCFCDYGCVRDSDCQPGEICVCADPIGECEIASCNAGTCPSGFECAEYTDYCSGAFTCQSAADQCESNGDCDGGVCDIGFDGGSHCALPQYCGTGRPFLVAGEPRLPAVASAAAWHAATVAPDVRGLRPALRAKLARHWTATARMEHASIAAFARFALQLLALGAPPDLLVEAQRAMADETAHARLAFTLASAFAGVDLGPSSLAIDSALDETSLRDLIVTTFVEGCIGETAAAVEATEAAALARDGAVRAVLERIATDETRHAQLAWRTVAWALGQARGSVKDVIRRFIALAEAEAQNLVNGAPGRDEKDLAAYGVLAERHKRRLRRDVLTEIVLPSARSLLAAKAIERS